MCCQRNRYAFFFVFSHSRQKVGQNCFFPEGEAHRFYPRSLSKRLFLCEHRRSKAKRFVQKASFVTLVVQKNWDEDAETPFTMTGQAEDTKSQPTLLSSKLLLQHQAVEAALNRHVFVWKEIEKSQKRGISKTRK